jgi:hypothetical protein
MITSSKERRMNAIDRQQVSKSAQLLMQILERPGLVAAVRELPGAVLGKLIDRIGLEDAGALVALASTAQLEQVFDDDLWRAKRAGDDERFRPERFALWLRVMIEAGEDALVQRLCDLPQDLVALAFHRLALVVHLDVIEEQLSPGDEEAQALERALENASFEEWEELRVIARDPDAWDDVWGALMALDRDHHDRLRTLLEHCRDMTLEYISGQGGLFQVLTADEMLGSDVAAARDDRRAAEGYVSAADARAFLELARRQDNTVDERDPVTRAYFRGLQRPAPSGNPRGNDASAKLGTDATAREPGTSRAAVTDARDLAVLLQEAQVISPPAQPFATLPAVDGATPERSHVVTTLFEQSKKDLRERDPARFDERVREIGYLVNVWMAGAAHEARRPRPAEAMESVLKICDWGLRAALAEAQASASPEHGAAVLSETAADLLFRRGFRGANVSRAARGELDGGGRQRG